MDVAEVIARLTELVTLARGGSSGEFSSAPSHSLGRVLASQAEGTAAFAALQRDARHQIDALDNGDYCVDTHGQSPAQTTALSSGVGYRVVYATQVFEHDAYLEATLNAITQGEDARVSDLIPSRLLIRDRAEALVIARGYPDVEHLGFHTDHPAIVHALCGLFDAVWERALPVADSRLAQLVELTQEQLELLRYLVLGRTDASIARSLGVSTRTVQRQIQAVQHALGAKGRFELGVRVGECLTGHTESGHANARGVVEPL